MNYLQLVFRGWAEANNLYPLSPFANAIHKALTGKPLPKDDLTQITKQDDFLESYFYREMRKAESNHYPIPEFVQGCKSELSKIYDRLSQKYLRRKDELRAILRAAEAGTLTFSEDNGTPHKERLLETIEGTKKELSNLSVSDFSLPLLPLTRGLVEGHIISYDLERIVKAINAASKRSEKGGMPKNRNQDLEPRIFTHKNHYLFKRLIEDYEKQEVKLYDVSYWFHQMKLEGRIHKGVGNSEFLSWLRETKGIDFDQIKSLSVCTTKKRTEIYRLKVELFENEKTT